MIQSGAPATLLVLYPCLCVCGPWRFWSRYGMLTGFSPMRTRAPSFSAAPLSSAWSQLYLQNWQVPWEAVFSPLGCSSLPGLRFAFACCLDVFKQIYFMFPCDFSRICFFLEFVVIKFFLELIGYTVFNRCLEGYFSARLRKKLDIFIVICKYLNRSHFRNILKIGKINI